MNKNRKNQKRKAGENNYPSLLDIMVILTPPLDILTPLWS